MPWSLLANKWVASALLVGGLGVALWVQSARLDAAQAERAAAQQVAAQWRTNFEAMEATNAANVMALQRLQAEAARIEAAAQTARAASTKLASDVETLRRRIRHAQPEADGPARPVLCDTVNELRRLSGETGAACGGEN